MIYGSYGHTGQLCVKRALERGLKPVLAGRNRAAVKAQAAEYGLEGRVFSVDEADAHLIDVEVCLVIAGPFSQTSAKMIDACLRCGCHYLDVTGEISVFEATLARHDEAVAAGVTLVSGVGFDVVPTDTIALRLSEALPDATDLDLAVNLGTAPSAGTAKTMVEGAATAGGFARIDGEITEVPFAWRQKDVPMPDRNRFMVSAPWGDVSTAFWTTGIPNITCYMPLLPKRHVAVARVLSPMLKWILMIPFMVRFVQWIIRYTVKAPPEDAAAKLRTSAWGQVKNAAGKTATLAITMPEGYLFTADSAIRAVQRVKAGKVAKGALTPSKAFGADFIDECEGVEVGNMVVS